MEIPTSEVVKALNSFNQEFAENIHLTDAILEDKDAESLLIAVGMLASVRMAVAKKSVSAP